jgi:hypothetical protein
MSLIFVAQICVKSLIFDVSMFVGICNMEHK